MHLSHLTLPVTLWAPHPCHHFLRLGEVKWLVHSHRKEIGSAEPYTSFCLMEKPAFFTPEIASQKQLKHHLGSTSSSNSSGLCRQPVPDRSLLRFLSPFGATPPPPTFQGSSIAVAVTLGRAIYQECLPGTAETWTKGKTQSFSAF